jgi:hypothetical protein
MTSRGPPRAASAISRSRPFPAVARDISSSCSQQTWVLHAHAGSAWFNAQVGMYLVYATAAGHGVIDREL